MALATIVKFFLLAIFSAVVEASFAGANEETFQRHRKIVMERLCENEGLNVFLMEELYSSRSCTIICSNDNFPVYQGTLLDGSPCKVEDGNWTTCFNGVCSSKRYHGKLPWSENDGRGRKKDWEDMGYNTSSMSEPNETLLELVPDNSSNAENSNATEKERGDKKISWNEYFKKHHTPKRHTPEDSYHYKGSGKSNDREDSRDSFKDDFRENHRGRKHDSDEKDSISKRDDYPKRHNEPEWETFDKLERKHDGDKNDRRAKPRENDGRDDDTFRDNKRGEHDQRGSEDAHPRRFEDESKSGRNSRHDQNDNGDYRRRSDDRRFGEDGRRQDNMRRFGDTASDGNPYGKRTYKDDNPRRNDDQAGVDNTPLKSGSDDKRYDSSERSDGDNHRGNSDERSGQWHKIDNVPDANGGKDSDERAGRGNKISNVPSSNGDHDNYKRDNSFRGQYDDGINRQSTKQSNIFEDDSNKNRFKVYTEEPNYRQGGYKYNDEGVDGNYANEGLKSKTEADSNRKLGGAEEFEKKNRNSLDSKNNDGEGTWNRDRGDDKFNSLDKQYKGEKAAEINREGGLGMPIRKPDKDAPKKETFPGSNVSDRSLGDGANVKRDDLSNKNVANGNVANNANLTRSGSLEVQRKDKQAVHGIHEDRKVNSGSKGDWVAPRVIRIRNRPLPYRLKERKYPDHSQD